MWLWNVFGTTTLLLSSLGISKAWEANLTSYQVEWSTEKKRASSPHIKKDLRSLHKMKKAATISQSKNLSWKIQLRITVGFSNSTQWNLDKEYSFTSRHRYSLTSKLLFISQSWRCFSQEALWIWVVQYMLNPSAAGSRSSTGSDVVHLSPWSWTPVQSSAPAPQMNCLQ